MNAYLIVLIKTTSCDTVIIKANDIQKTLLNMNRLNCNNDTGLLSSISFYTSVKHIPRIYCIVQTNRSLIYF